MNGVEIKDLNLQIGDFRLKNINLNVPKGTVLGLVGKNGAGKTTLINAISNVYLKESGQIYINGNRITDDIIRYKKELGISYDKLLVSEYIKVKVVFKILKKTFDNFDESFFLSQTEKFNIDLNKRIITLSYGMRKKLSLILTLSLKPKVLILDEPTAGIDPADRIVILNLLYDFLNDETNTIIYSTHITSDLDKIADYVALIDDGQIIFLEEKDQLINKYRSVYIEKEQINDEIRANIIGLRENVFGYEGLLKDNDLINKYNLKSGKPNIEEVMLYHLENVGGKI